MIYFIQSEDGGPIKIGTTIRLSQRLKQLAAESGGNLRVLAVTDGDRKIERMLHERFDYLRVTGEWFEPGDDLTGFIVTDAREWDGEDEQSPAEKTEVRMRLDTSLAERIQAQADAEGLPVAAFIRSVMLKEVVRREKTGGDK